MYGLSFPQMCYEELSWVGALHHSSLVPVGSTEGWCNVVIINHLFCPYMTNQLGEPDFRFGNHAGTHDAARKSLLLWANSTIGRRVLFYEKTPFFGQQKVTVIQSIAAKQCHNMKYMSACRNHRRLYHHVIAFVSCSIARCWRSGNSKIRKLIGTSAAIIVVGVMHTFPIDIFTDFAAMFQIHDPGPGKRWQGTVLYTGKDPQLSKQRGISFSPMLPIISCHTRPF